MDEIEKNIQYLYHHTRVADLESILAKGTEENYE